MKSSAHLYHFVNKLPLLNVFIKHNLCMVGFEIGSILLYISFMCFYFIETAPKLEDDDDEYLFLGDGDDIVELR